MYINHINKMHKIYILIHGFIVLIQSNTVSSRNIESHYRYNIDITISIPIPRTDTQTYMADK